MTGKEFGKWMKENRISLDDAAALFGVSEATIYSWRSVLGVPARKREWVRARMIDHARESRVTDPATPFVPRETRPGFFEIFPDDVSLHRADRASRIAGAESLATWCHDVITKATDAILNLTKKPITYLKKVAETDSDPEA